MSYVPQDGNWTSIPESVYKFNPNTHSSRYYRLEPNKPSPTIANYRKLCLIHPTLNRGLSVSETGSLMGLDKNFKFFGNLSTQQQMTSNGVTQAIGKLPRQH